MWRVFQEVIQLLMSMNGEIGKQGSRFDDFAKGWG